MPGRRWSVVVPVRGAGHDLVKLHAALARQTYPASDWELVVVDDGSAEPVRLADGGAIATKVIRLRASGPGPARNRGVAEAQGEWVAFTAADCEPAPNWLASLENASRRWREAALGGVVQCGLPESAAAMTSHLVVKHLTTHLNPDPEDARFFTPNNLAVPVEGFRAIGGFGEGYAIGAGEDRDFCARWRDSGRRLVAAPEALVVHTHPLTLVGLLRQQYRYGRGSGIYRKTQRGRAAVRFERAKFYVESLRAPWRENPSCQGAWVIAGLLGVSQAVSALGVVRELVRGNRGRTGLGRSG